MTQSTLTATSTMQDILAAYPAAQRVLFRKYHIGGCSSCGFQPSDRLQDVLQRHGCQDPVAQVLEVIAASQSLDDKVKVDGATLQGWIDARQPLRIVDMRGPEAAAYGTIPGAIPLTEQVVQQINTEWPKQERLVLCCDHGVSSADGAAYLAGHGFTDVWSLVGGIEAWAAGGRQLQKA